MAISTVQELVTSSLRLLRAIDQEVSTPTSNQSNQGMDVLNSMLDSLSIKGLKYRYDDESVTVSAASHTWGSGGSITSGRPLKLLAGRYVSGSDELPVDLVDMADYRGITQKDVTGIPELIAYDPEYPLGKLYVWPVFSGVLKITSLKPFTQYSALSDSLNLPPGYVRMMRHALAVELAGEYGMNPPTASVAIFNDMKSELARLNSTTPTIRVSDLYVSTYR